MHVTRCAVPHRAQRTCHGRLAAKRELSLAPEPAGHTVYLDGASHYVQNDFGDLAMVTENASWSLAVRPGPDFQFPPGQDCTLTFAVGEGRATPGGG